MQHLANIGRNSISLFDDKESFERESERRFGNSNGWDKWKEKARAYNLMTHVGHLVSMILSFFFVYSLLYVPATFIGGNMALKCGIIAVTILFIYEWIKKLVAKDAADGILMGWHDYTQFKPVQLILALGLCVGSFFMCKEGAEDLLAEITDKTEVIADDGKAVKEAITTQYATQLTAATTLLQTELKDLKADKNKYVNGHSWKGHIDTRDKAITENIALYD